MQPGVLRRIRTWVKAHPKEVAEVKSALGLLLNIVGAVTFLVLAFMFWYMVAFLCIIIGFMKANRGSGGPK